MDALRRYVFPLLWLLIFAVIALALAKLAFFPSGATAAEEDTTTPSAEFDQFALVGAEAGDIASELALEAVVQPDPGTELLATETGEITKVWVADGDEVREGDRILQVRIPEEPEFSAAPEVKRGAAPDTAEPGAAALGAEGEDPAPEAPVAPAPAPAPAPGPGPAPEQEYRYVDLRATADGTIRDLAVIEWQSLSVGERVATLSPGTYSIVAELAPEQQLSLLDVDIAATAQLPSAADPITCRAPDITEDTELDEDAGSGAQPPSAEEAWVGEPHGMEETGGVSAAQLRCPVPESARVVPGLSVQVTVALGSATDVLTVPTTAVEGEGEVGTVYALEESTGEPAPLEVTLGLRGDGVVEIVDGLEEGQQILQFVPGVDDPEAGMGGEVW